jgi:ribosome-associated toxin RatA of RatAB toxin-antitoxin module
VKVLRGSAATAVTASPEQCVALLAAIDRYPAWYPDVIRHVEVLERGDDGLPRRARTSVHLALGPLANDFHFEVAVRVKPRSVVISRLPGEGSDQEQLEVRWQVRPGKVGVELEARLSVPRMIPVGGAGDSVAQGFAEAARRVLDGERSKASAISS